jgi:hypothetical protein
MRRSSGPAIHTGATVNTMILCANGVLDRAFILGGGSAVFYRFAPDTLVIRSPHHTLTFVRSGS